MYRRSFFQRLIVTCVALCGLTLAGIPGSSDAQTPTQAIRLIVDYGDGVIKLYTDIPWVSGETILDVMNSAKTHSHGITFDYTGSAATAFLSDIDGVANQGGGGDKKNWQYWLNTSYGDKSFAVQSVQALDTVVWRFASYQSK